MELSDYRVTTARHHGVSCGPRPRPQLALPAGAASWPLNRAADAESRIVWPRHFNPRAWSIKQLSFGIA